MRGTVTKHRNIQRPRKGNAWLETFRVTAQTESIPNAVPQGQVQGRALNQQRFLERITLELCQEGGAAFH